MHIAGFPNMIMYYSSHANREDEVYYYHGDLCGSRAQSQACLRYAEMQQSVRSKHLGSASWITNNYGSAVQHLQYLPYGEPFVNQRTSGYNERFTFTGKERDEETGYGYFGARYMDHELMTSWLSVDPMADKYPAISPYNYCMWNPIKIVDPKGLDTIISFNQEKPNTHDKNYKEALEKYEKNQRLTKYARQYRNTSDIIHVFAHGLIDEDKQYLNRISWGNGAVVSPKDLSSILSNGKGSKVFLENEINGKGSVVMLHSCYAGQGENSFARQFSADNPNCLIIAPTNSLGVSNNIERVLNNGCWRFFYNGEMIYSCPGGWISTFIMERMLELLGADRVLKMVNEKINSK